MCRSLMVSSRSLHRPFLIVMALVSPRLRDFSIYIIKMCHRLRRRHGPLVALLAVNDLTQLRQSHDQTPLRSSLACRRSRYSSRSRKSDSSDAVAWSHN